MVQSLCVLFCFCQHPFHCQHHLYRYHPHREQSIRENIPVFNKNDKNHQKVTWKKMCSLTKALFSSLTSRYSISPSWRKSSKLRTPAYKKVKCIREEMFIQNQWNNQQTVKCKPAILEYGAPLSLIHPCQQLQEVYKLDHHQKQHKHNAVSHGQQVNTNKMDNT